MIHYCYFCKQSIAPDAQGMISREGVTEQSKGQNWVWGPEPVHEECRLNLKTPFDDREGYIHTGEKIRA